MFTTWRDRRDKSMEQTEEVSCRRQGMGIQNQPREEILEPKDTGHSQVQKIPRGVLCGKEGSSRVLQKKKKNTSRKNLVENPLISYLIIKFVIILIVFFFKSKTFLDIISNLW